MNKIKKIYAGDTAAFTCPLRGMRLSDPTSAQLILRGPSAITIDGKLDGKMAVFFLDAETSAGITAGRYSKIFVLANDCERESRMTGFLEVAPDPATAEYFDGRSEARRALDEARKAYYSLLNGQIKSYTIGSRQITRYDLTELASIISSLEARVFLEEGWNEDQLKQLVRFRNVR